MNAELNDIYYSYVPNIHGHFTDVLSQFRFAYKSDDHIELTQDEISRLDRPVNYVYSKNSSLLLKKYSHSKPVFGFNFKYKNPKKNPTVAVHIRWTAHLSTDSDGAHIVAIKFEISEDADFTTTVIEDGYFSSNEGCSYKYNQVSVLVTGPHGTPVHFYNLNLCLQHYNALY